MTKTVPCQNYECWRDAKYIMQVLQVHGYTVAVCEQCAKDEAEYLGVTLNPPYFQIIYDKKSKRR